MNLKENRNGGTAGGKKFCMGQSVSQELTGCGSLKVLASGFQQFLACLLILPVSEETMERAGLDLVLADLGVTLSSSIVG